MVDAERVDRLLARVDDDLRSLRQYRDLGEALLADATALAATKYYLITAVEGCVRVAQHLAASEEWPVPETNAEAVRALAVHEVIAADLGETLASAVGLRNLLVHRYANIDDRRVLEHLGQLDRLREFVVAVARWVDAQS